MVKPMPATFELVARRVKIKNGGTTATTSVVTVADDGTDEHILGVLSVQWSVAMTDEGEHDVARAVIVLDNVEVDLMGTADA